LLFGYTTERTVDKAIAIMQNSTSAKARVLDRAEHLFNDRGYTGVSMRDIADSLAIRQASLYYHVPEGKEQLYVEVATRSLRRHQAGIDQIVAEIQEKRLDLRLLALADWFIGHAPLRLLSMLETDMASLSAEHAQLLTRLAYESLFVPIAKIFAEAQERGEIREIDPPQLAGYFLSLMDGISYSSTSGLVDTEMDVLAGNALDVLLNGLYDRGPAANSASSETHII
jgi:AcrR family transcriptional regulator